MRVAVFSTKGYDRTHLLAANADRHELVFFEAHLDATTAPLADGFDAVCPFVNDDLSRPVVERLAAGGVRLLALRSAGYNHVDLTAAREAGMTVARVPAYSPHAVAEHAVALLLALNRRLHRAAGRVREGNFSLEGLMGFDLAGKTVGVVGTGQIGQVFARIMQGFDCTVLGHDPYPDEAFVGRYVALDELLSSADVVSLHCPLTPETRHLVDTAALATMKDGAYLLNTSRGALVDARAVIEALKAGTLGGVALDVYEEEGDLFFEDLSNEVIQDDVFSRLLTFPNVLITGHQAFFTAEAVGKIAEVTIGNLTAFEAGTGTVHAIADPKA